MTVEAVIRSRLTGNGAVAALAGARIYYAVLRQGGDLPAVRFSRIGAERPSVMGEDAGLVDASFQFDIWGATADDMANLRNAVRAALQRWNDSGSDPEIVEAFIADERDHGLDRDLNAYRAGVDVTIWHRE